jgi:hypothetical protein
MRRDYRTRKSVKRSRYNLLPYFIDDEKSLAKRQAYVASCEKFFKSLGPGPGLRPQARKLSSLTGKK